MEFRSSKPKDQQIILLGRRPNRPNLLLCKKHPKHQQSPGVCSICLNDRLSQLSSASSSSSTSRVAYSSSSSSSSLSSLSSSSHYSASASSCSSPVRRHRHYRTTASDGRGFSMTLFRSGKNVLAKSRSVAFITRRRVEAGGGGGQSAADDINNNIDVCGKKKGGFWSKLLRPRNKRIDSTAALPHSRTMNERMAVEVH